MGRRQYIDWARGLAVLVMIEAHTLDAWTRLGARTGRPFGYAAMLGGFAAPAFLWLAGLGAALSASSAWRRSGSRRMAVDVVVRRGLEIFLLAFLFRLQAFIVSPGSYPVTLFRVDILNIMGPAMVVTALAWATSERPVVLVVNYAVLSCACAMLTPLVRTSTLVNALPIWVQWYLRPFGDYTTFTAFPWVGFVFAGAGCGVLLTRVGDRDGERRIQMAVAAAGLGALVLGLWTATRPSIYPQSSYWTSSPTYFAVRVGILMLAFASIYAVAAVCERYGMHGVALARLGRSSLFIYWIHVELVYGYATWPLRHRLPLWGTALACALFSVLMFRAVGIRDRIVETWRARRILYSAKNIAV